MLLQDLVANLLSHCLDQLPRGTSDDLLDDLVGVCIIDGLGQVVGAACRLERAGDGGIHHEGLAQPVLLLQGPMVAVQLDASNVYSVEF